MVKTYVLQFTDLTNRLWFRVVSTLTYNDMRHHSGQNVVDSRGEAQYPQYPRPRKYQHYGTFIMCFCLGVRQPFTFSAGAGGVIIHCFKPNSATDLGLPFG